MPQKIDVYGLFIDPETITDLLLQKRISVFYPVFYEVEPTKSIFGRFTLPQSKQHILRFDHQEPYGIILADPEQPDPASYVVNYKEAALERVLKGFGRAGKNITGHISELLKIEISGDRKYRILQSGRNVKQTSIREIPAKVHLLNGQWVDVFKSSPDFDFQGGTPYAVTDVNASALMITMKDKCYVLFGAGIDASNEEVLSSYYTLAGIYNEIQAKRDKAKLNSANTENSKKLIQMPQIKIQFPPVLGKKQDKDTTEVQPEPDPDTDSVDKPDR